MVTFALIVFALILMTALGMEVFRMLASRLQIENQAEYVAEVVLSDVRSNGFNQSSVDSLGNQIMVSNYFLAKAQSKSLSLQIVVGCFRASDNTFTPSPSACTALGYTRAVVVYMSALDGAFAKILAQLFTAASIDIRTRAISYVFDGGANGVYFVTGPFRGTLSPPAT